MKGSTAFPNLAAEATLFVTSVIPGDASNPEEGKSHLYCLNYKTGMPAKGATSCGKPSSAARGGDPAKGVMDLGPGLTMSLALYRDPSTDSGLLIFTQTSSGIVNQSSSTIPPNTRSSEIDWREIH